MIIPFVHCFPSGGVHAWGGRWSKSPFKFPVPPSTARTLDAGTVTLLRSKFKRSCCGKYVIGTGRMGEREWSAGERTKPDCSDRDVGEWDQSGTGREREGRGKRVCSRVSHVAECRHTLLARERREGIRICGPILFHCSCAHDA